MNQNVRLQNLRDFTVQIRNDADQIVGTGIAVSMDGKVVTCRHVVETALRHKNIEGAEVGVYFPQVRGGEEKKRKAIVEKYFKEYDDDVVLLQLTGGSSPLAPEQIAVLGTAEDSQGNGFRSFGYRKLENYIAGLADGKIMGSVKSPLNRNLQVEPVMLNSLHLSAGMSGAAVLDVERNLVIGLVAEDYYRADMQDRDTAYAVNCQVLGLHPINLSLVDNALPLESALSLKIDTILDDVTPRDNPGISLNGAPTALRNIEKWSTLLEKLNGNWDDFSHHLVGLIGLSIEDKRSFVRGWLDSLLINNQRYKPKGVFWWNFYENSNIDDFINSIIEFMVDDKFSSLKAKDINTKAQIIGGLLKSGRYLFILDGTEILQFQQGDQFGLLRSVVVKEFLQHLANPEIQSFCVAISRISLFDLISYKTYTEYGFVPQLGGQHGATSDTPSTNDHLGYKSYVDAFGDLVESPYTQLPLTVGVYGSWGMGKSFILKHVEDEIKNRTIARKATRRFWTKNKPDSKSDISIPKIYTIYFNAWEYSSNDIIWPGLVRKVMDKIEEETAWGRPGLFLNKFWLNLKRQWKYVRAYLVLILAVTLSIIVLLFSQFNFDFQIIWNTVLAIGFGGFLKLILLTFIKIG